MNSDLLQYRQSFGRRNIRCILWCEQCILLEYFFRCLHQQQLCHVHTIDLILQPQKAK